jgi:hypothetical protein
MRHFLTSTTIAVISKAPIRVDGTLGVVKRGVNRESPHFHADCGCFSQHSLLKCPFSRNERNFLARMAT